MLHTVIIPKFIPNEINRKFIPHVLKIQKGDWVRWINMDDKFHSFRFYKILDDPPSFHPLEETLSIQPGEAREIIFDYDYNRIDYVCINHREEINSITIFTENYENMSNTQRLRYLSKRYNIKPPDILRHLDDTV